MDIQNWFAIASPKEMTVAFAEITALYYAAQTGRQSEPARRQMEARLNEISDSVEWFAASMFLEAVAQRRDSGIRWAVTH
ncbi:MAG: hypothetical protein ACR2PL_27070 [Dehalococcoidia bacterium]